MIISTAKRTKEQNSTAKIPHDHSSETAQVVPAQAEVSIYWNQILNLEDLSDFGICLILISKSLQVKAWSPEEGHPGRNPTTHWLCTLDRAA